MTDFYHVNGKTEEQFPEGFRYYDEGVAAAERGEIYNRAASLSWKDGFRDVKSATRQR